MAFLLTFLMIGWSSMRIATGRSKNIEWTNKQAIYDAVSNPDPQYTDDPDFTPLSADDLSEGLLPNRTHVPRLTRDVSFNGGDPKPMKLVTVGSRSAWVGPAWTYNSFPVPNDQPQTQQWFENRINDSHQGVIAPLGLDSYWLP
jgi:hypothetical protein